MSLLSAGLTSPLAPNARLRFDVIRRVLSDVDVTGSFLEIGCGQGAAAMVFAKHFDYTGVEPDTSSYQTAQLRLMELGTGRIIHGRLPATPEATFDVVGAFEVLEHLEDDQAAMTQWVRWLRPNGYAIVSVPAHPQRYGPWDAKVGHFRRYTRSAIETVLVDAGLVDVKAIAYGFPLGYVLEWGRHWVASRRDDTDAAGMAERTAASGRSLQPRRVAAPLIWAGTLPFVWLQRLFPARDLGTGFVAYGRRPE